MSIIQVRNFLEKSGCGLIVAVGMGIVFAVGIIGTSCSRMQRANQDEPTQEIYVAKVGSTTISILELDQSLQARQSQMIQQMSQMGQFETFTPEEEASQLAQAIYQAVDDALMAEIAKGQGVKVDDAKVKEIATTEIDRSIQALRQSYVEQGKIKADATQAQFEEAFKKESKSDIKLLRDRQLDQVTSGLADPKRRPQIIKDFTRIAVLEKFASAIPLSDDDLKRSRDILTVKRVFVPNSDSNAKATIEKAQAELKSGKAFEDVVATYSKDLPEPNKTLKESVQSLPMNSVLADPKLSPVKALKPGETSGVLELSNGYAIYKLVKVQSNAPADFDKKKAELRSQIAPGLAFQKLQSEIQKLRQEGKITWQSKGFELLYEVASVMMDPTTLAGRSPINQYEDILKRSQAAIDEDIVGRRAAIYAAYIASNAVWRSYDEAKKKANLEDRRRVIEQLLSITESPEVRLEFANALIDQRDKAAVEQLTLAASGNNFYGPLGQKYHADIDAALARLRKASLIDEADAQKIVAEQQRWIQEKRAEEQQKAEDRKREEEERKKAEAEMKAEEERAKAEEAKAKAEEAKQKPAETAEQKSGAASKPPSSADFVPQGPGAPATK